ncbi:MAG: universal stress protein A [Thiotrichales bacterium]|nr:MAG: universal stress protein A [Thiotrichales bacterium]
MLKYKHILAATDMHDDCLPIVARGVDFAKQYKSKLSIINVVPTVPYYMAAGLSSIPEIESQLEDESTERLESIKKDIDYAVEVFLRHGSPKVEIVKLGEKLGVDLIIVGSHGKHGAQLLLGSTSSGVLHRSLCDVLVVRTSKTPK